VVPVPELTSGQSLWSDRCVRVLAIVDIDRTRRRWHSLKMIFTLPAKARVDGGVTARQGRHSAGAPHARSPPSPIAGLDPGRSWGSGEWRDDPRLTDMGVKDDAMGFGQAVKGVLDFLLRQGQLVGYLSRSGHAPGRK
jgi:hypothetical protein